MFQTELFPELPQWEERDFHGYWQVRYNGEPWKFEVTAFGHDDCVVIRADKTRERVPIDKNNRIFIAGKWYGPRYWHH